MSLPHDMVLEGRPTPRNDSVASATIAAASEIVVMTMTGAIEFGSTWRTQDAEPRDAERAWPP